MAAPPAAHDLQTIASSILGAGEDVRVLTSADVWDLEAKPPFPKTMSGTIQHSFLFNDICSHTVPCINVHVAESLMIGFSKSSDVKCACN
jgi:hypothetical protein